MRFGKERQKRTGIAEYFSRRKIDFNFNYEIQKLYAIRILATDDSGLTAFATVNVNILDENDPPVYIGPKSFQIEETLSLGSAVGVISATDPDLEGSHAYSQLNFEIDQLPV